MTYDVLTFAKNELDKYLKLLGISADIKLGLFKDFDIDVSVPNATYDDAIAISVKNKKGYVAGSNERSVLIGVYRLLEEWGIRWVRPGKNGTYYPSTCEAKDVDLCEKAAKRHRTMCIEGAVSLENVLDMVEWCPKAGFNGYYIQFDSAFTFFDRWYSHQKSTVKPPEEFTEEKAIEYVGIIIKEIKKRGLMLHRMGHGWNCMPFGIVSNSWEEIDESSIPPSYIELCAQVNGKRTMWDNKPMRTQLCYTNPIVIETISDAIVEYTKKSPETDVIHFWLGDWANNYCECDECAKYRVSDVYIKMINRATEKLEAEGIDKLIVFTIGSNKSYPPSVEKLSHPDKLILMFAPISRTFAQTFPSEFKIKELEEYVHNGFKYPRSVDENLSYLYAWEQCFKGDALDFDYHLMWDHILDAGGEGIARVIHGDIQNFENLGLNGFISCQLQRNSFPTSIAMTVMGKTLWNNEADFEKIKRELYTACFGEDMLEKMSEYFATISRGFDVGCIRSQRVYDKKEFKENMLSAIKAMKDMLPVINAHLDDSNECRRECWQLLALHAEIYVIIGEAIIVRLDGDVERSNKMVKEAAQIVWEKEDELQGALDSYFFEGMTRTRITPEKASGFSDT